MEMSVLKEDELAEIFSPPPNMFSMMDNMCEEVNEEDIPSTHESPEANFKVPDLWNMGNLNDEVNTDDVRDMFGSPGIKERPPPLDFASPGMNCMKNLLQSGACLVSPAMRNLMKKSPAPKHQEDLSKRTNYHQNIETVEAIRELNEENLKHETFFFQRQNSQEKLHE